jgi:DNA-binding CsgD family transcriptional regulator
MRQSVAAGLLERAGELEAIRNASRDARHRRGTLLLIEGEAGIGKTRLIAAAREMGARAREKVLGARGSELERDFAFGIVRQLFEPVLNGPGRARARLMAGAAALAAPLFGDGAEPLGAADSMLHGLYWLTANLAERGPVMITLDDVHWSDAASLRFVHHLARRLEGLPVLVVAAARPVEPHAHTELLERLKDEPVALTLRPAPLSGTASAAIVRARLPSAGERLCRLCHEASGGNPFLLEELAGALEAGEMEPGPGEEPDVAGLAPESVRRSTLARLGALPTAAAAVARATAIFERARLGEVAALAELRLEDAARCADELRAIAVLGPGEPLEFMHPLLRTAVYAEIPRSERAVAHLRAAHLSFERGGAAEDVAAHLMRAEPSGEPWAVDVLLAAAEEARARGAPETCATYMRRVLDEPLAADRRLELLVKLGWAETAAALPEGVDHLMEAFERATAPAVRTEAALGVARALSMSGDTPRAAEVLARAAEALAGVSPEDAMRIGVELIMLTDTDLSVHPLVADRLPAEEELPRTGPLGSVALAHRAVELLKAGECAEEAVATAERAVADDTLLELGMAGSQFVFLAGFVLVCADRNEVALAFLDRGIAQSRARGLAMPFVIGSAQRAHANIRRGSLEEAEADADSALAVARLNGWLPLELMGMTMQMLISAERDPQAGLRAFDDARLELERIAHVQAAVIYLARGKLRFGAGDALGAADDLLEGGRRFVEWGVHNPGVWDWRSARARALHALGQQDEARALATEELELARRWGTARAIGVSLHALGVVEGGEAGLARLGEAASTLGESDARLEHARALIDLGAALRRANRRVDAREPLAEGLEMARRCGGTLLAERAAQELAAAGARPRRERLTGVDALTPTERRIASLAAEGRSNPEIAQSLFVTRKTVEFHLSNAYRKLGIHSREALGEALAPGGKD